ncbi:MAG: hypothetical protein Kilf2KO_20390 [Rhodospirillales bacterium]
MAALSHGASTRIQGPPVEKVPQRTGLFGYDPLASGLAVAAGGLQPQVNGLASFAEVTQQGRD